MKKVHLSIKNTDGCWVKCCNKNVFAFYEFSKNPNEVTCKSCIATNAYKEAVAKAESERELEPGEFVEPIKAWVIATTDHIQINNMKKEEYEELFDYFNKEYPKHDFVANDDFSSFVVFGLNESQIDDIANFVNNGFIDLSEGVKTVRSSEWQKLNNNFEPEEETDTFKSIVYCENQREIQEYENWCTFNDMVLSFDNGVHDLEGLYFTAVFKTEESRSDFNKCVTEVKENIEKYGTTYKHEDVSFEPEEETNVKIEIKPGWIESTFKTNEKKFSDRMGKAIEECCNQTNSETQTTTNKHLNESEPENNGVESNNGQTNNHRSHYEKTNGELEQIDKMELIICHGIPAKYHQTIIDNLNLALASKYLDRLGKKDETNKEIDKMKNYVHRSVKREWR